MAQQKASQNCNLRPSYLSVLHLVEEKFKNNHSQIFQISSLHLFQEYDAKKL